MREFDSGDIRNFAVVGHGSSGKTTLCEAIMLCSGAINRMGTIEDKNTVSDYHHDEQQRQISIHATKLQTEWLGRKLNIIDCPGYADFSGEGLSALGIGDFGMIVVDARSGVEVGTEQAWQFTTQFGIPKVIVVNGVDKDNVAYDQVLAQLKDRIGSHVFPVSLPVNPGDGFDCILDVFRSEIITYTDAAGSIREEAASGEWKDKADALHAQLIEHIAESDDTLLEKFFDKGTLSEEELRSGIHTAIQQRKIVPVFAVSATKNVGVTRLLDFVAKYGSSPLDRKQVQAFHSNGNPTTVDLNGEETVIYVFKTMGEEHVGELSFFRVYSGTLTPGMDLYNSNRGITERFGQIFQMSGKKRSTATILHAGDIGSVVKLKDTHTGDTLCSPGLEIQLPAVDYPNPNIHASLRTLAKGDEDKISIGLATLHQEDPTFQYRVDSELHQTIVSGRGELHLQVIKERLKQRFKVDVELGLPRIPFRETIRGKAESKYRHKKQSGGSGQFAEVWMRIEPKTRGEGVEFGHSLSGQNVDRSFVPSVEKGVRTACEEGVLAGYRVVDLKVDFYDGKQHPVDSKDVAFQIAGKHALRDAVLKANPCLLEPINNVQVKVPEVVMGDVIGDISSRRGKIQGVETDGHFQIVKAQIPMAEMNNYGTSLRSMTGGRGMHSEDFSHYQEMPREFEQKVLAESKQKN